MYTIERNKTASFDVDAQKGFTPICPNELPVQDGDTIADKLNRNSTAASLRVGSKDAHPSNAVWNADGDQKPAFQPIKENYRNVDVYWPAHCVVGTKGGELLDTLPHPQDYDFFIWKGVEKDMHPYGACYHDLLEKQSTGVIEFLSYKGIQNVIVGGLATDFCVVTTVRQFVKSGFDVYFIQDSCKGINDDGVFNALQHMKEIGVFIVDDFNDLNVID